MFGSLQGEKKVVAERWLQIKELSLIVKYLNANSSNMFSMSLTLVCLMESFTLMPILVI